MRKIVLAAAFIAAALFYGIGGTVVPALAEDYLNINDPVSLPRGEDLQRIRDAINGQAVTESDAYAAGLKSSFYNSSLDTPITRFLLGKINFNFSEMASLYAQLEAAQKSAIQKVFEGGGGETAGGGVLGMDTDDVPGAGNKEQAGEEEDDAARMSLVRWNDIESLLNGTQNIFRMFEVQIPLLLLCLFFVIQLGVVMYHYVMGTGAGVSALHLLPRFMLFFIAIATYQSWVCGAITVANYVSNFVCSQEDQKKIMDIVWQYSVASVDDGISSTIAGVLLLFFRWLTYACVMVMLVIRDMLLGVTVLVGGMCISFGFITTYASEDPMREYLSGWFRSFFRLLMWGIFASAVIYSLGILTLLRAVGEIDILVSAIFALATLYVSKDIPNLAEKMSGLALTSLLAAMAPAVSKTGGNLLAATPQITRIGGHGTLLLKDLAADAYGKTRDWVKNRISASDDAPPVNMAPTGVGSFYNSVSPAPSSSPFPIPAPIPSSGPAADRSQDKDGKKDKKEDISGAKKTDLTPHMSALFKNTASGINRDLHNEASNPAHHQVLSEEDHRDLQKFNRDNGSKKQPKQGR